MMELAKLIAEGEPHTGQIGVVVDQKDCTVFLDFPWAREKPYPHQVPLGSVDFLSPGEELVCLHHIKIVPSGDSVGPNEGWHESKSGERAHACLVPGVVVDFHSAKSTFFTVLTSMISWGKEVTRSSSSNWERITFSQRLLRRFHRLESDERVVLHNEGTSEIRAEIVKVDPIECEEFEIPEIFLDA